MLNSPKATQNVAKRIINKGSLEESTNVFVVDIKEKITHMMSTCRTNENHF